MVVKATVGAAIGGIVNAVCTATHGGNFREVADAFAIGAAEGAFSSAFKVGKQIVAAVETVITVYECRKAGASWGESILAGSFSLYSSLFYTKSGSLLADAVCDLTLGLGVSLLSTGLTKQIKEKKQAKAYKKTYYKLLFKQKLW